MTRRRALPATLAATGGGLGGIAAVASGSPGVALAIVVVTAVSVMAPYLPALIRNLDLRAVLLVREAGRVARRGVRTRPADAEKLIKALAESVC